VQPGTRTYYGRGRSIASRPRSGWFNRPTRVTTDRDGSTCVVRAWQMIWVGGRHARARARLHRAGRRVVVAALLPSVVSPPRRSRRSYAKPAGRPRAPASARTWWYMLAPVSPRSHTAGPGQVVDHMPRPLAIHLGGLRLPAGTYGLPCRPRIFPKNLRLGRGRTAGDRPPAVRPSAEWWEQLAEWAAVAVLPEAHRVPAATVAAFIHPRAEARECGRRYGAPSTGGYVPTSLLLLVRQGMHGACTYYCTTAWCDKLTCRLPAARSERCSKPLHADSLLNHR
jgi:hypothetical protein